MSPLRTQRARAALAVSALVLALGSLALASPASPPLLGAVSEPAPLARRSRAGVSAEPLPGRSASYGDGGTAIAPAQAPPQPAEDEPGTIVAEIIARFCVPYVAMYCAGLADCTCPATTTAPERCESEAAENCAEWAVHSGRGAERLDLDAIDACLTSGADRASACVPLWGQCAPFATALARDGERCPEGARHCADGVCDDSRTCRAYAGPGARCHRHECRPGYVCGGDRTCVEIGEAGARCSREGECQWPLACRGGRCRPRGGEGTTCHDDSSCETGMRCGERGRCVVDGECGGRSTECGRDQVCMGTPESRCVVEEEGEWPLPELGHRCDWLCAVGSMCVGGRCVRAPGDGQRCDEEADCGPGLACTWGRHDPVCVPAAALGAPCDRDGHELPPCALDAICDQETSLCVPRPGLGQTCDDGSCAIGLECAEVLADGACVPSICEP